MRVEVALASEVEGLEREPELGAEQAVVDLDAAIAFYSDLFGWEVEKGPEDMGHYSMARLDGKNVAGLADQQVPGMTVWTTYLAVDDVDASVALATELARGRRERDRKERET